MVLKLIILLILSIQRLSQMSSAKLACALPWRSWFGEANPARSAMFF
jgi:hypothetical protein